MTRRGRLIAVGVLLSVVGARLGAHPASTTEVAITVGDDGTVSIDIVADAGPFLTKLEALRANSSTALPPNPEQRVHALSETLLEAIDLRIDRARVPLALMSVSVVPATQPARLATTLSGWLPDSGSRLTWKSSLVFGAYPMIVRRGTANQVVQWLNGAEVSQPIDLADLLTPFGLQSMAALAGAGFLHIVPKGLDHILFVVGLFLLSRRRRDLLWQITAFTVAHSVTLGLAIAGVIALPGTLVEPLIALSIVYVGVENLRAKSVTRSRVAIVFAFGLLHGLGFAAALTSLGGSQTELLRSLFAFNAGVEAGQLAVVALATAAVSLLRVPPARYQRLIARPASVAIAIAGCLWVVERVT